MNARQADIIVVGAGVQGAALAFHLAGRGADVLVLEKGDVGGGSTGRSSGFVRMHYDLPSEAAFAWASLPYFERWDELVGQGDPGFVNTGFIQLVPPAMADRLRANVEMMRGLGIDTRSIDAGELAELVPGIATDDIEVAAYEPRSGYALPSAALAGLREAVQGRGGRIEHGRTVTSIATEGDRVVGVDTDDGRRSAPIVVNAAGPWAAMLAKTVGLELPIQVWRHETFFVGLPPDRDRRFPIVLDHARKVYFRPDGADRVLVGLETGNELGGSPDRPLGEPGDEVTAELFERASSRLPWLAGGRLVDAHRGQDGMTPDQHAIIDRVGPEGHYLLCGFSGSGFKTAPAVGQAMAELILDGVATSADLAPYDLGRFERGELLVGEHPYPDLWQ